MRSSARTSAPWPCLAARASLGDEEAREACAQFARQRYGEPARVIDLYLRSSPGSPARQALWDFFDNDDTYKPKVAAQGGDGVLTRLSMLALFALGLLGAVLLLAWLAIRLFTQAAIAFVLLLAAPFALFFPLLGDCGSAGLQDLGADPAGRGARQGHLRRLPLDRPARHRDPRRGRADPAAAPPASCSPAPSPGRSS